MCWDGKRVGNFKKDITKEDITVYKIVSKSGIEWQKIIVKKFFGIIRVKRNKIRYVKSMFRGYKYIPGVKNPEIKLELKIMQYKGSNSGEYIEEFSIEKGYHSYSSLTVAEGYIKSSYDGNTVLEFIIPEGSEYYENFETGEIVSSQIILKQI